jgi:hypothetical protein
MWWMIAVFVVSLAVAFAFQPKPQSTPPPGLNELNVPTAEEGREIPVLFGTRDLLAPNVVWYGDLQLVPIKKKGGKK